MKTCAKMCLLVFCVLFLFASCAQKQPVVVEESIQPIESKEKLFQRADLICLVEITNQQEKELPESFVNDAESMQVLICDAKVIECIKGSKEKDDRISIVQRGDNRTIAYSSVLNSGGYLENGQRYLLFLEAESTENQAVYQARYQAQAPYMIISLVGQYKVDSEGKILSATSYANNLFSKLSAIEDLKTAYRSASTADKNEQSSGN